MNDMLPLMLITFLLTGFVGILVIYKLYRNGAGLLERLATALTICASLFVLASGMTNYYIWLAYGHWPEVSIGLAVLSLLCVKLLHVEATDTVRYVPRIPIEH